MDSAQLRAGLSLAVLLAGVTVTFRARRNRIVDLGLFLTALGVLLELGQ